MPLWRAKGLLAFTINLQGGSPEGYSRSQPWMNSSFETGGSLRPDYVVVHRSRNALKSSPWRSRHK